MAIQSFFCKIHALDCLQSARLDRLEADREDAHPRDRRAAWVRHWQFLQDAAEWRRESIEENNKEVEGK